MGKEAQLAIDLNADQLDEVMPTSLEAAKTSVQFILTSLSLAFEMRPKQATNLLANNHRIL